MNKDRDTGPKQWPRANKGGVIEILRKAALLITPGKATRVNKVITEQEALNAKGLEESGALRFIEDVPETSPSAIEADLRRLVWILPKKQREIALSTLRNLSKPQS